MATLFSEYEFCSNPEYNVKGTYSYTRSGSTVNYSITITTIMKSAGGWYNNVIGGRITLAGTKLGIKNIKPATSGTVGLNKEHSATWSGSVTATSGTVSCKVEIADRGGAYNGRFEGYQFHNKTYNLTVPPAASTMGSNTAGSTLSGPTVNVTKYSTDFTDNITLTYNSKTITRNGFTSGKLTFTEAERLLIFQAQGAGTTKSWSISGTTYSGSTSLGTYSGSVNITTEALSTITAANDFNVEDSTSYTVNNPCGGTYAVYARVSSYTGTNVYSASGLTTSTSRTVTPTADTIYSSNASSKTGTIYWRIVSYINGTAIGTVDKRTCTYTFIQSRCGPSVTTFNYAITDTGTKTIMGSTGAYYAYNVATDKEKFIAGKTTLNIQMAGSVQKSAASTMKYHIVVPGQTNTEKSSTSGTQVLSSKVLTASGTLYAYVTDSRGFSTSLSFAYTLNDYYLPSFDSASLARNPMSATNPNQDKYIKVSTVVSLPNYMITANQVTLYYRSKASTTTTWGVWKSISFTKGTGQITVSNVQLSDTFDQNTQYDFQFGVQDYYQKNAGTYSLLDPTIIIPVSAPLMSRRAKMIGINKVPTRGALDVSGIIYASNGIVSDSYVKSGTNMEVGTYIVLNNVYNSSTNACTIQFKRSDGTFDILKVVNGEIFLNGYELLQFEEVDSW